MSFYKKDEDEVAYNGPAPQYLDDAACQTPPFALLIPQ